MDTNAWNERRRALFDDLAPEYVREREAQHSFATQKRMVLGMLDGVRGRVLDVGCGPAMMEPALLDLGFKVEAIDVSPEMIRLGRSRIASHPQHARCALAVGDVARLGCPDAHYDAAVAMGVLEYVADHGAGLRELHRALKPGGVLVLTVPSRASAYRLARNAFYRSADLLRRRPPRPEFSGAPGHNRPLPWRLDALLERTGFRKLESRFCNFILFPLAELAPAASERLNRALSWLSDTPLGIWGNQYIVKAVKAA